MCSGSLRSFAKYALCRSRCGRCLSRVKLLVKISTWCWHSRLSTVLVFFGILYAAYIMVLDRQIIKGTVGGSPLSRITENRHLIRLALVAAVALSITGSVQANTSSQQSTINTGKHLKTISIIIFLVVAGLLVVQTVFATLAESRRGSKVHSSLLPQGLHILLVVGLLFVVRETFLLITNNKNTQYEEHLFYPFEAGTELAAVLLFLTPGLVPLKREVAEASMENSH